MKSTHIQAAKLSLILLPLLLTFGTKSAIAQITPATDGTGTIVNTQNNQINISGGTQAGGNQFHSFQQFGLNAGQTANFLSNPSIANILGRVTGGDASLINGILKVSGSNANLYLINPAGIVFGKDASLNVPATFTATTANGIGFGNGNWFSAMGSNNYAKLTANPTSFGFSGLSGSIVNAGNLSVNPGQSIALVGGTVVNTGTIAAPGGNITIAAIPGGKMVRIDQAGTVLSLDLPTSDRNLINAPMTSGRSQTIATPLSLPALLTGGSIPSAMGVVVEDGVIKLTGGSASVSGTLNADGTGVQNGGNVVAYADNHLDFGGTIAAKGGGLGGNGGFVDTSGKGSISIAPNAKVLTTATKGLMGTWLIDPADLEVVTTGGNGTSTIGADTIVTSLNTTNVNLQADNSITVNAAIDASSNVNTGNLTLTAPIANLNQAIIVKTGAVINGTATMVNVGAAGRVQDGIDVAGSNGTVKLAAATYTLGNRIVILRDVTVNGAGAATTIVSGDNKVGVFYIASGRKVTLNGMSIVNGKSSNDGGGIFNDGGILKVSNSIISGNSAPFSGGGINNKGNLTVSDSTFSQNSADSGGGIFNSDTLLVSNSTLNKNSAKTDGGGIYNYNGVVTVKNSTLSENTTAQNGGGIFSYGTILLDSSTVSKNTSDAGGGIYSYSGTLDIINSTISGNLATSEIMVETDRGGGIYNNSGSTANVGHSTISGNTASGAGTGEGGGIANNGTFNIINSIVAGNTAKTANNEVANLDGIFTSQGYNLYGQNNNAGGFVASSSDILLSTAIGTALAPLGNYGGSTQTMALLPGSPALNAGNSTLAVDQRGIARVTPDIGAFESQGFTLVATAGTPQNIIVGKPGTTSLTVTVKANNPIEPVAGGIVNINFTAPNSPSTATLLTPDVKIDASGNASTIVTASNTEGSYTVKATATGITGTADFALTNIAERVISIILPVDQNPVINNPSNSGPQVQVPIDRSRNLETRDRVKEPPSLNIPNPLLCALRQDDRMIGQPLDAYKGVPDCKAKVIQSTPIESQSKTDR